MNEQAFDRGLVARGSHYLLLGGIKTNPLAAQERDLAQRKLLDAWTFISPINNYSFENVKSVLKLRVRRQKLFKKISQKCVYSYQVSSKFKSLYSLTHFLA